MLSLTHFFNGLFRAYNFIFCSWALYCSCYTVVSVLQARYLQHLHNCAHVTRGFVLCSSWHQRESLASLLLLSKLSVRALALGCDCFFVTNLATGIYAPKQVAAPGPRKQYLKQNQRIENSIKL